MQEGDAEQKGGEIESDRLYSRGGKASKKKGGGCEQADGERTQEKEEGG